MKKEPHITEFTAKRGSGLHVRVCTTRGGNKIAVDGGRLYFKDYATKAETMRAARRIRDDILNGLNRPASPTVDDVYRRSFDYMPVSITTRNHIDAVYTLISPFYSVPVALVTAADIQLSLNDCARKRTQYAVKYLLALWRRIYRAALYMQLPVSNLPEIVTIPKSKIPQRKNNVELTPETFAAALDLFIKSSHPLAPTAFRVSLLMYYTGMRITECLGLYISDLDVAAGVIHIRRNSGANGVESGVIVPLKTPRSFRDIPISSNLADVLQAAIDATPNHLLFPDTDGGVLSTRKLTEYVHGVMRSHGVPFSLYKLRHLFSADMFRAGIPPAVVQSLMGHSSVEMSLYYAFATESERKNAVESRK